ncbi:hypothetical protein LL912_20935 [Niabella sp. CC-SYL272]|uniref:glycoside hydrolase family 2 TIM barrel-domain containing protein n=1 Tax=Niabella agricola TaxID=2891571 RepID=UPI001F3A9B6A|nr:glycoside hydrolase family 2 TIM barrel-domain containing protein [Niabella agricola]MCF3111265.1 hypothetical protein [Niabella agricola]
MILRDCDHLSVLIWSIGNEIYERKKPEAVQIAAAMVKAIHVIDSTRPVTSAVTTWDKDWEIFDPLFAVHDIAGYNYQGEPASGHGKAELFPWHGAYCGDIDLTGWRNPISYCRNLLWNNTILSHFQQHKPFFLFSRS